LSNLPDRGGEGRFVQRQAELLGRFVLVPTANQPNTVSYVCGYLASRWSAHYAQQLSGPNAL
jgi:hypothetical protein